MRSPTPPECLPLCYNGSDTAGWFNNCDNTKTGQEAFYTASSFRINLSLQNSN